MEHAAQIAAKDEELEKAMKLKNRKIAANDKKFQKKLAAADKANDQVVSALQSDLEVSTHMIPYFLPNSTDPIALL